MFLFLTGLASILKLRVEVLADGRPFFPLMCFFIFHAAGSLESELAQSQRIFIPSACLPTPQQVTAMIQPAWRFTLSFTHHHCEPVPSTLLCSTFTITIIQKLYPDHLEALKLHKWLPNRKTGVRYR